MVKQTALATMLGLTLMVPAAAAQVPAARGAAQGQAQVHRPALNKVATLFRSRIQRGVRAGRITPAELSKLRAEMAAFRSHLQAGRQGGLSPADRHQLRLELRRIGREIARANRRKS